MNNARPHYAYCHDDVNRRARRRFEYDNDSMPPPLIAALQVCLNNSSARRPRYRESRAATPAALCAKMRRRVLRGLLADSRSGDLWNRSRGRRTNGQTGRWKPWTRRRQSSQLFCVLSVWACSETIMTDRIWFNVLQLQEPDLRPNCRTFSASMPTYINDIVANCRAMTDTYFLYESEFALYNVTSYETSNDSGVSEWAEV